MQEDTSNSVYYLINDLCENLIKQHTKSNQVNTTSVRKLKSRSFEVLLKKSKQYCNAPIDENFDSFRELNICYFSAKICAKNNSNETKKLAKFEEHLQFIANNSFFNEENGQNILQFLLLLENNKQEQIISEKQTYLLVPGPFTLHANYKDSHHYPKQLDTNLCSPPQFFKGVHSIKDADNPYLPRIIFDGEPKNKLLDIDSKFATKAMAIPENSFTGLASKVWGNSFQINVGAFRLFRIPSSSEPKIPKSTLPLENVAKPIKITEDIDKILSWNWENLDCIGIPLNKPHIAEANLALELQAIHDKSIGKDTIAKIVSQDRFFRDLKSLTVGIQSDSFVHDEHILFKMIDNITVMGILPGTIENYVTDFIECGTCYKRLQIMIMKRNYKLMFEGFIFKALCSAVDEYLVTFRQFVFSVQNESLLEFYKRMKKMMKQISNLSYTLAIHPCVDVNIKPPMGSQFLGYLYREIMRVTERDFIMLLVFILRRCCHVYFKYLQKWLFYGVLDDPSNELFICFVDHYRQNTKYFYDKAYFVRKDSVPGFFQGYEDQVLQCGKYTMLLKSFKPNHPLFELDYPSMSVCLTFEEVQKFESSCKKYTQRAREVCGKPITIRDVFEKQLENKKNFRTMASEKSRANMEQWSLEQETIAAAYAEQKKKRHEELTLQLQDAKNRKISERQANIEVELKLLKEAQNMEENRLLCDNINLKKRIEYYTELSEMLDEQLGGKKSLHLNLAVANDQGSRKAPDTPISTAGTDFESCFGDEDAESVYGECITADFVENFAKNETELNKMMQPESCLPTKPALKMSTSDYFNCNEIPEVIISDIDRNRTKILGGSEMSECMSETIVPEVVISKPLTDAQKNRFKVLHEEFGMGGDGSAITQTADINFNPIETVHVELTDLQKNRKKMMQNDTFAEYNKDPLASRKNLNLDLNTERARNRKKVLESEFNILTGIDTHNQLTPMSTTSDTMPSVVNVVEEDKENANISLAKVDLESPASVSEVVEKEPPPSSQIVQTPECGLNTAGILARQGFNFVQSKENSLHDTSSDRQLTLSTCKELPAIRDAYQRCEELVKSNFKCQPVSPHFRLNYGNTNAPTTEQVKDLMQKQRNLNSLSVITLTEFLQKSIVLPMSTHLDIINSEVMRVFLEDLDVLGHFKSLRNYFFLMDGEFGSIICDGLIGRLENGASPSKLLNYQTLHSILDTALGSSIMGNDKNAENLSFIVSDVPEKFDLNSSEVLSNLTLSYRIDWPLNLILNPETLDQYANIFKYLIKVRRISWVLEESYQILKEIVKKTGKKMLQSPQYIHVQQIRHKFYHFVHALKNHITSNALQASWKTFKDDLINATSIEDIYRKHTTYVKRILFLCMLNRRSVEFYNAIEKIFKISLRFYGNLKSRDWKLRPGDEHYTHSRYEKLVADEAAFENFIKYTIYLGKKIVRHGYQEEIGEFIHLINYNQYYIVDGDE
ncbi:gamma-tubulin complex component 6 [Episyrphus balteatus]|uniref:gamma-tubulin complex component 6 n=1 Tax=Episyrphus balteatus TaxID=286459 RepID=UPI002486600C|nr:gamma-tubulin complex component 6 [Episyrphus balteatus]